MRLGNFYHSFIFWVESRLTTKLWLWQVVIVSLLISLFLAFPPYTLLIDHFRGGEAKLDAWLFIHNQAQNLLHPEGMEVDIRRENMIFRWFLPFLSLLTGHSIIIILILQGCLGVLFLFKIGEYVFSLTDDKVAVAFFILAIANTFVSVWFFADVHGYGDGFAYFFLLAALLSRNPIVIFFSLQAAFFTDERAVVAGGYLLLWWVVTNGWDRKEFDFTSVLKNFFLRQSTVVWIAWIVYFSIRYYVQVNYFPNHEYSTLGTPVLFSSAHRNGLGSSIWGTFEGTWLIMLATALVLFLARRYFILFVLFVGFLVLVATGIFVHDIDRALAYGFPFLLISIFVILKSETHRTVRVILFFSMIICVFSPQVFYMGYNRILWLEPLPFKVLMYIGDVLGWSAFK